MKQTIVRVTPDDLGYKDRGIIKWSGMMLSDHSEALKNEKNNNILSEVSAKDLMSEEQIAEVLFNAYANSLPLAIQANVLSNGNYYQDLECKVLGYSENNVYLILKDGKSTSCTMDQIRNVEIMCTLDWYYKER